MLLLQAVSTGSTVGVGFWSVDVGGYGVLVVHWLDEWSMDPLTVGISPRWEKFLLHIYSPCGKGTRTRSGYLTIAVARYAKVGVRRLYAPSITDQSSQAKGCCRPKRNDGMGGGMG
jgi:hypothetical protein